MKSYHDIASVISEEFLESIRECYNIPEGYALRAPSPKQRPYQTQPSEISISVDALEAVLHFPLHPTIVKCLRWWRTSPSQMAPNSWRYLIAFLGECRGAGIVPSRTLLFACFLVCKSHGVYYLTARAGFKVSGAPTNNKGWKARYFFVSVLNWGFRADWSIHPISNVPPLLSEEESVAVNRLILPLSRAIRDMTERYYGSEYVAEEAPDARWEGRSRS
ncbi:hypothetical protein BHE74_00002323 [Ensete ventricosum]|nr:hypothetical protein BHE74_00002323 [Ensete ventricosum]